MKLTPLNIFELIVQTPPICSQNDINNNITLLYSLKNKSELHECWNYWR